MRVPLSNNHRQQTGCGLNRRSGSFSRGLNRCGYTLVEMLAIIGITGTLMSLAAVTFRRSIQSHQLAMDSVLHQRQLEAVRLRLKQDLATAQSISSEDAGRRVLITCRSDPANNPANDSTSDPTDSQYESRIPHSVVFEFDKATIARSVYCSQHQLIASQTWSVAVLASEVELESTGATSLASIQLAFVRNLDLDMSDKVRWTFRVGYREQ